MKTFDELPQELKSEIIQECGTDMYGLKPDTLYRNIANSTGTNESLANIFEVETTLVDEIKKINS